MTRFDLEKAYLMFRAGVTLEVAESLLCNAPFVANPWIVHTSGALRPVFGDSLVSVRDENNNISSNVARMVDWSLVSYWRYADK